MVTVVVGGQCLYFCRINTLVIFRLRFFGVVISQHFSDVGFTLVRLELKSVFDFGWAVGQSPCRYC